MKDLEGKVAVVTGAGRAKGLGQGIAQGLAQRGCRLVIADIGHADQHLPESMVGTSDEMESIAAGITADTGVAAIALACVVRDEAQVERLIKDAISEFKRLDILVNNAGIGYVMKPLVEVSQSEWQAVLDVNLMGAFLTSKHAARQMIAQGNGGRIVNIASQGAKSAFPHLAAYISSKHGMIGLTRSCAMELGEHGITVNAVCPNHVTTGLGAEQNKYFAKFKGMTVDEYLADMRARNPMGREGKVGDTADVVAFLCSDGARYINGDALNVSGGEEMH